MIPVISNQNCAIRDITWKQKVIVCLKHTKSTKTHFWQFKIWGTSRSGVSVYHVLPSGGLSFYLLAIIGSVQRSTSQRTQTATLSRTKESNIINLQHILLYQWTKRWKTSMCLKQENGSPTLFGHLRQTSSKTRNIKKKSQSIWNKNTLFKQNTAFIVWKSKKNPTGESSESHTDTRKSVKEHRISGWTISVSVQCFFGSLYVRFRCTSVKALALQRAHFQSLETLAGATP